MRIEDEGHAWPEVPEWVDLHDLGSEVLADLRGLSKQGSDFVAGHLAAAGELADSDPDLAWEHARAARSQGGRIAVVRETVGLVAYRAEKWADAIAELRAARRMAGGPGQLAVMADAERALGRPERAIELSRSPEARNLDPAAAAELQIVVAGARADLGQRDAGLAGLRAAAADVDPQADHAFRLYYAYAAMLEDAGQREEALAWFVRAADADSDDDSDAAERAASLAVGGAGADPADMHPVDADSDDDSDAAERAASRSSGDAGADPADMHPVAAGSDDDSDAGQRAASLAAGDAGAGRADVGPAEAADTAPPAGPVSAGGNRTEPSS